MAKGKSFQGIAAWKRNTNAWGGAAVAAGALDGIKVIGAPLEANRVIVPTKNITGRATQLKGDTGNKVIQGDILSCELVYEGNDTLIAPVFGTAGAPSTVDTSGKKHVWKIKDSLDGTFFTLAYEIIKDTLIYEFNTVKVTGLTIRGQQGGRVMLTVRGIAHDFSDASADQHDHHDRHRHHPGQLDPRRDVPAARRPHERAERRCAGRVRRPVRLGLRDQHRPQPGAGLHVGVRGPDLGAAAGGQRRQLHQGHRVADLQPPRHRIAGRQLGPAGDAARGHSQKIDLTLTGDTLAGAATQKFQHILYLPSIQIGDGKPQFGKLGWTVPVPGVARRRRRRRDGRPATSTRSSGRPTTSAPTDALV
jgi:hypothetical protein